MVNVGSNVVKVPPLSEGMHVSVQGKFYRYTQPEFRSTAWEAGDWNKEWNHRFSEEGFAAVHGADSPDTAKAEASHSAPLGKAELTSKEITADKILDLTDSNVRKKIGVERDQIAKDGYGYTQEIARQARKMGYKGIKYPSARNPNDWNIAIFQ